jgi:transposase
VAPELASKSYNATKKMHYYGVRAHIVSRKREGALPDMEMLMLEEAARQDGPVFDQIRPMLQDNLVFADQAYKRSDAHLIEASQNLKVLTPCTKKPGQKTLEPEQKAFSKAVSRTRQPIEAFFGWINRCTDIQNASLVRSSAGLLTHIFGRFAAAMMLRAFPEFDF